MMSSYFFKILAILLAIAGIVEKVQSETEIAKSNTKVENESKNSTTKGLQCDNSNGWKNLDANHTKTECKNGHCFGAWLTGKYQFSISYISYTEKFSKTFDLKAKAKLIFFSVCLF